MNPQYRPLVPVNPQGLDDIALALLNETPNNDKEERDKPLTPSTIPNREQYIILPTKTHGKYTYPDMLVAMDLTHLGKTWYDTHKLLAAEGNKMLTICQFVDFINLIKTGRAFNGAGKPVDKRRLDTIIDNIMTVRNPVRAEWFDAKFESRGGFAGVGNKMYINYNHTVDAAGNIKLGKTEQLEPYFESDKKPGINAEQWLRDASIYGIPKPNIATGDLYYWHPRNDHVARFDAYSGGAYLSCDGDPTDSGARLGVRASREKI